jgi:putative membrane fusion protein
MALQKVNVKKEKRKKKNYLLRITAFILLGFCAYGLVLLAKDPVITETVRYGTMEDKINCDGFIIRDEYVINSPFDGTLSCAASEGERVNKNTKIATVFEGKVDESVQSKIASINQRLSRLQREEASGNLMIGDIIQIDSVIAKTIEEITDTAYSGDLRKITAIENDLCRVIRQRISEKGEEVPSVSKTDELLAEKKRLEGLLGEGKKDLYAPVSGVFSSVIDGLEGYFNLSGRIGITPDVLDAAKNIKPPKNKNAAAGEGVVKIVDNYEWFFAAAVDSRWVEDLKPGSYVMLRFPDISDKTLDANIDCISEEKDGRVTVVISCMQFVEGIYSARNVNADIIRKSYSGFKIPLSAIRVREDGTSGVYIVKDSVAEFRNIQVLHQSDNYAIAKEDNKLENGLLLYDEVVISGSDIKDGKIIR